tara:strand:+ start:1 stop:1161 length:1161 start_codon:yes stop_codon:yes gene_type:complete
MSDAGTAIFNHDIKLGNGTEISISGDGGNSGLLLRGNDSAASIVGTHGSQPLVIRTNSAERMRIDAAGRVGINTTSPTSGYMLHVGGSSGVHTKVKIEATTATGQAELDLSADPAGVSYLNLGDENSYNIGYLGYFHSDNSMRFQTNSAERMRILSTGNVGIGTTAIEGKLTIGVNTAQSDGLYINNAASGGGELDLVSLGTSYSAHGAAGGEIWLYSPDNINIGGATGGGNSIKFLGNGATRMKVHADGNIDMPNRAFAEGHFSGSNTTNNTGWAMTVTASNFMTYQNNATHGHGLTVQKAGYYLMFGSSLYDPAGTYVYIGWCINGGQLHHWHSNHTIESNHDFVSSVMHHCNVGDHITMENSSQTVNATWGGNHSVFHVLKVT